MTDPESGQTEIPRTRNRPIDRDLAAAVNLGCGDDYRDGWLNVDVRESSTADRVANLDDYPWPFPDDAFEHCLMDNVIEHLDDRLAALEEIARIVEPGGTVVLRFPHWNSAGHYTNPTHTNTLTHRTFDNYRVDDLFNVVEKSCTRVRAGRLFPEPVALWLADMIGQIVSEVEVTLEVQHGATTDNSSGDLDA